MCFGTEVMEKLEEIPEVQETESSDEENAEPAKEQGPSIALSEAMIGLILLKAIEQNVGMTEVIGKEGVHVVARALLMLPVDGPISPETKTAFNQFISTEAKRLTAGALAEVAQEEQSEFAGR